MDKVILGKIKELLDYAYSKDYLSVNTPLFAWEIDDQNYDETISHREACVKHCNLNGILPFPKQKSCFVHVNNFHLVCAISVMIADGPSITIVGMALDKEKDKWSKIMDLKQELVYQKTNFSRLQTDAYDLASYGADSRLSKAELFQTEYSWQINGNSVEVSGILSKGAIFLFPCGYRFSINLREGVGRPSIKKKTKGKSITFFTTVNRIYTDFGLTRDGDEKSPHYRRPHIRHLWKAGGLNRLEVPTDPIERLNLIVKHNIERVWVKESYPGFKDINLGKDIITTATEDLVL